MEQNRINLTARDLQILDTLALRVRVLSVGQIAQAWFGQTRDAIRNARRRIRLLHAAGYLETSTMAARPPLTLEQPLFRWAPGKPPPNEGRLSWTLSRRWTSPAIGTEIVIASRRGGTWLGGHGGRLPRRSEVSHDLTLAALYLKLLQEDCTIRTHWLSEAMLRERGFGDHARLPDALIEREGAEIAIELGGEYGAGKLREFHAFCVERVLPYEIW